MNIMNPDRRRFSAATLLLISTAVLLLLPAAARAQKETDDQIEFSYIQGAENGPERWGKIKAEWATCGKGRRQSPIALSYEAALGAPSLGYLTPAYRAAPATVVNRGHDIQLRFDGDAGSLPIGRTAYRLRDLHWHSPSEHTIDGRRYDLELHMVHRSADGRAAVLAFLYQVGADTAHDPFLRGLERYIRRVAVDGNREEDAGVVDPRHVRGFSSEYYRYMGSLTTPPCSEGVIWTVATTVRRVSSYQLHLLRRAVHDGMENNARPLQKANNRDISIFEYTTMLQES